MWTCSISHSGLWRPEKYFAGDLSLLQPHGSQRLNSDNKPWWQSPLPAEPYHQPKTPTQFLKMSLTTPLQTHIILLLKFSIIHSHSFLFHKRPGYIKLDSLKFLVSHNYWNWHILQYRLAWHVLMIYQQNTGTPATHLPPCQR